MALDITSKKEMALQQIEKEAKEADNEFKNLREEMEETTKEGKKKKRKQYNYKSSKHSKKILKTMERLWKVELDKWQKEIYNAKEKNLVIKAGRQTGKTIAVSAKVLKFAMENPHTNVAIFSPNQRQSVYLFDYVKDIITNAGFKTEDEPTKSRAKLANGSKIFSLPVGWTGRGVRSFTLHVAVFEEAAYIPREVFVACYPMLASTDGQRVLLSTPAGPKGEFYKAWHNDTFRRWHYSSEDCDRISDEFLEQQKNSMSKNEYAREYKAEFTSLEDGLIDPILIGEQMMEKECKKKALHFMGVDVARFGKDKSVIVLGEYSQENKSMHICRADVIRGKRRTTHLVGKIVDYCKKYNIRKIIVDEAGVGGGPVDMLVEKLGKRKVLGINNASRPIEDNPEGRRRRYIKEDLYSNLIKMLENRTLTLDDDIEIAKSLRAVRYKYNSNGKLTIFGNNHDVAEALVRAIFPMMFKKPIRPYVMGVSNLNRKEHSVDYGDRRWGDLKHLRT